MLLIKLVPPKLLFLDENHFRIAYQNSLVTEKYNKTGLVKSIYLKKKSTFGCTYLQHCTPKVRSRYET
jgi:hypothetical protein